MKCHNDKTAARCRHAAGPLRLAVVGVWNRWRRSRFSSRSRSSSSSAIGSRYVGTRCAITAIRTITAVRTVRGIIANGVAYAKRHHERFSEAPMRSINLR